MSRRSGRSKKSVPPKGRWYGITDYFNPLTIETIQKADPPMFYFGRLADLSVVQVKGGLEGKNLKTALQLSQQMRGRGMKPMIVDENVAFLKIRECTPEEAAKLNEQDKEKTGFYAGESSDSGIGLGSFAEGSRLGSDDGAEGDPSRGDVGSQIDDDSELPEDDSAQGQGPRAG